MKKLLKKAASLRLTVVCLLLLMVLVFWGTLYQVNHGLYAAQQRFYGSWFFSVLGIIPLPGTQLVLTVLFANLLAAMLVQVRYGWRKTGIVLIHLGLILLLGGGFVIRHYAQESFLSIEEGAGTNLSSSYGQWELAVWEAGTNSARRVWAMDTDGFQPGREVAFDAFRLRGEVEAYYANCQAFRHGTAEDAGRVRNASGIGSLKPVPVARQPEENTPGLVWRIERPGGEVERVLLYGNDAAPVLLPAGEKTVALSLRRKRFPLPFVLQLVDFKREMYPNSTIPKSFSSLVRVRGAAGARHVLIEMNKPLRYKGYTLYQHSYSELKNGRESSTLAVVKNVGRLLPYVASIVTFLGLLIHFGIAIYEQRTHSPA